jgi:hypothetical protein
MAEFPPHSELVIAGDAIVPRRKVIEVTGLDVDVR